jgi:hypothetical protein
LAVSVSGAAFFRIVTLGGIFTAGKNNKNIWNKVNEYLGTAVKRAQKAQRPAVLIDDCCWHGCIQHATWPAHRAAWWRRKIEGNKTRDRVVNHV